MGVSLQHDKFHRKFFVESNLVWNKGNVKIMISVCPILGKIIKHGFPKFPRFPAEMVKTEMKEMTTTMERWATMGSPSANLANVRT